MKFVCHRCATRYSIGDDRVRGKILKIRCKNCANVITVREGMDAEPATAAPAAASPRAKTPASKPPPALEEEWYVSIDGEQSGPFSLAEAQRWVSGLAFDAELHCWSEGFDDWLPVDKVSHFRGLRKKPPTALAPPPLPRVTSGSGRAAVAKPQQNEEDEPKPLFAATMASLEKAARSSPSGSLAAVGAPVAAPAVAAPSVRPHVNGVTPKSNSLGFDSSELPRPPDPRINQSLDDPEPPAAASPIAAPELDDIDIGEVSRVVNLADLARPRPVTKRSGAATNLAGLAANARLRGSTTVPRLGNTAPVPQIDGVATVDGAVDPVADVAAPVAVVHRRGMISLLIGAAVLIGAAIVIVVIAIGGGGDSTSLGGQYEINNERPDQIVVRPGDPNPGSATEPVNPFIPRRPIQRPVPPVIKDPPPVVGGGNALKSDEIEQMASKSNGTTQRCWIRAQRGASGIDLADVKKITVTLAIGPDGSVTDVQLSDNHAGDALGKCLVASIRSWKFRSSPGGTFRFVLHFS